MLSTLAKCKLLYTLPKQPAISLIVFFLVEILVFFWSIFEFHFLTDSLLKFIHWSHGKMKQCTIPVLLMTNQLLAIQYSQLRHANKITAIIGSFILFAKM